MFHIIKKIVYFTISLTIILSCSPKSSKSNHYKYDRIVTKYTKIDQIVSSEVNDTFYIFIRLPKSYSSSNQSYPVLYALDGDIAFNMAVSTIRYLQFGKDIPEMIIVEFLDENDQPVVEGEPGEVTITTLGVEAMPLLRFKTGDICYHFTEPCSCGRTTMRLGPVIGRKKHMIKLKGTTLYPPAIVDVLNDIEFIENYVIEVFTNHLGNDEILIRAGCKAGSLKNEKEIKDHFRSKLRVAPEIKFFTSKEITELQFAGNPRKPINFVDNRKQIK